MLEAASPPLSVVSLKFDQQLLAAERRNVYSLGGQKECL